MRAQARSHHRLAETAEAQYGVVSRAQLRALGYSGSAIGRALASGRLHRVHRGVYAVGHRRLSAHGQCHAAVLACRPGALLSHSSAAWLWGLVPKLATPVEVVLQTGGYRGSSICVHHSRILQPPDRTIRDGLPVAAIPRVVLDLASTVPRRQLERALDRAELLGMLDVGEIDTLLARAGRHPGIGALRSALDPHREPCFTRSGLERRFLELVRASDLPMPAANAYVAGFELDAYWEAERFAVELDGYEYHRSRSAFERDRARQEELKLAGIEMVRITARRIAREPEEVVGRLRVLLGRRRGELAAAALAERSGPQ